MCFMFRRRRKPRQVTLRYLKKEFDKNGEYRYVLVSMETKKPYATAKKYKDAMDAVERSVKYDYPLYVVDLLYWKG